MAYTSEINLGGLGEVPKTTDVETFADFTDVYNAIHILTQYTSALLERAQEPEPDLTPGGPDRPPWEAMPFDKWFYAPAAVGISRGSIINICKVIYQGVTYAGAVNGAATVIAGSQAGGEPTYGYYPALLGRVIGVQGMALESVSAGQLLKVGIGPGIINIPGATTGIDVYAYPSFAYYTDNSTGYVSSYPRHFYNNGGLYLATEGAYIPPELLKVGTCVAPGAVFISAPQFGQFGI